MSRVPAILTVDAVDARGHEGLVRDAEADAELECRGAAAVTGVFAAGDSALEVRVVVPAEALALQIRIAAAAERPAAFRTGLFFEAAQVHAAAAALRDVAAVPLVVAPTSRVGGTPVYGLEIAAATRDRLYPLARVVVARVADLPAFGVAAADGLEGLRAAAAAIREQGAPAALVTGAVTRGRVIDVLDDGAVHVFDTPRVQAPRVTGLAGAHAAALAAHLGRGWPLDRAVDAAQRYVADRLRRAR